MDASNDPHMKAMAMKRLTCILVLAGVVGLTPAFGDPSAPMSEGPASPARHAIQANSDFAWDLYAQLAKANAGKNLFFSPYSISSALAMTAEGARGATALEMGNVLRFPPGVQGVGGREGRKPWEISRIHTGMAELNARLNREDPELKARRAAIAALRAQLDAANARVQQIMRERTNWRDIQRAQQQAEDMADRLNALLAQVDQYELRVANALWGEKSFPFAPDYVQAIAKYYETGGVFPADFRNNFPAERVRINAWIEEQTRDRIKDLIPPLRPAQARLMRLILTNAIYFKGEWAKPFEPANTKPRTFTLADGATLQAATMSTRGLRGARYGAFNADGALFDTPRRVPVPPGGRPGAAAPAGPPRYPGPEGFAMLELPYKGGDLSMVLIAPNRPGGLGAIESKLTTDNVAGWLGKLQNRDVHVLLPKFKLETNYALHETLQAMGMVRAFQDPRLPNGADFSGMTETRDPNEQLYIAMVLHKAFVEVNEKGTEAAAATAVMMMPGSAMPVTMPFTPTFAADRPFVLAIREAKTGSILFLGRVNNPTAK